MNNKWVKILLFLFMAAYVVAPDMFPGPIDDLVVILLSMVAQKKLGVVDVVPDEQ